jgi:hypothetical protein
MVHETEIIGRTMGVLLERLQRFPFTPPIFGIMPISIIAALAGAAIGRATKKTPKKKAVSKYTTKTGKKVKAYTKNA